VAGTMAGLKKYFPLWPKQHDHGWFSYWQQLISLCCCINHPLKNAVNEILSKGKIHPTINKKRYVRQE
jgi:hypothetical protein